jgi:hypothetical protein
LWFCRQERIVRDAGLKVTLSKTWEHEDDPEWRAFEAWETEQLASSPADVKDTDDFRFRSYSRFPPWTRFHQSLAAQLLTKELWARYLHQSTSSGFTFSNLVQGAVLSRSGVGLSCGDEESYRVFADLVLAVVRARHGVELPPEAPPAALDPADADGLADRWTEAEGRVWGRRGLWARLTARRNVGGFALPSGTGSGERRAVAELLGGVLGGCGAGTYCALEDLDPDDEDALADRRLLPAPPGPGEPLAGSGAGRDWPRERGVWWGDGAAAWVNAGDDHLLLFADADADGRPATAGPDLPAAYRRLCDLAAAVDAGMRAAGRGPMRDARLGFLTGCPADAGAAFVAAARVRMPTAARDAAAAAVAECAGRARLRARRVEGAAGGSEEVWEVETTAQVKCVCARAFAPCGLLTRERELRDACEWLMRA